jgi:hypothetical protein
MSTLDGLIFGIKDIINKLGVTQPTSAKLKFTDGDVAYNEVTKALEYTPPPSAPNFLPFGPAGVLVTPPDVSTFTQLNPVSGGVGAASTAVIQNHSSGYGVVIYGTGTSAHECFNGVVKTRGSNTSLIVQVDAPYWDQNPDGVSSTFGPFGGIVIYSPANHKVVTFGPAYIAAGDSGIVLLHQDIGNAATATPFTLVPARSTFPVWLKWHDDGANYNFSYCFDGDFTHAPTIAESRTAYLADAGTQVGVACGAVQQAGTRAGVRATSMWLGSWSLT